MISDLNFGSFEFSVRIDLPAPFNTSVSIIAVGRKDLGQLFTAEDFFRYCIQFFDNDNKALKF